VPFSWTAIVGCRTGGELDAILHLTSRTSVPRKGTPSPTEKIIGLTAAFLRLRFRASRLVVEKRPLRGVSRPSFHPTESTRGDVQQLHLAIPEEVRPPHDSVVTKPSDTVSSSNSACERQGPLQSPQMSASLSRDFIRGRISRSGMHSGPDSFRRSATG
jgi:hypothetical protein